MFDNFRTAWDVFAHHPTPVTRPLPKTLFWFVIVQMMIDHEYPDHHKHRFLRLLLP